jgi:hypothetical protein
MKTLLAALLLISSCVCAQPLASWSNNLATEPMIVCDGAQRVILFHPSPGSTIYVREMQAWPWPQGNFNLAATGYIGIQKYSTDTTKQTFMDIKHFYGTPNAIAKPDFAGGSMMLGPTELIMVEAACSGTQWIPGFTPRYQVLWTTVP